MSEENSPFKGLLGDFAGKILGGGNGTSGLGSLLSGGLGSAVPGLGVGMGILGSIGSSIFGAAAAKKAQRAAEKKEAKARKEMNRQKDIYANLDISNPFLNLENKMEDLTIDQKASQFQKQQFQQSQSNILEGLRGAAGGSGVAALAQQLSQSGQLASQQSAASIGQQESRNQMAERQEASRLEGLEIQGEYQRRADEKDRVSTFMGMAQQETAAYAQQAGEARQARTDAITGGIKGAASMFAGFGDAKAQSGTTGAASAPPGFKYDEASGNYIPE